MLFTIIKSQDKRQLYDIYIYKGWKTDAENITHDIIQYLLQNCMKIFFSNLASKK